MQLWSEQFSKLDGPNNIGWRITLPIASFVRANRKTRMNRNLGLVAGLAILASVTTGLFGYPMVGQGLAALGIVSGVALGLSKRNKHQAQPK